MVSRVAPRAPEPPEAELEGLLADPDEARVLTDFFSVPPPAPDAQDELDEPQRLPRAPRAMWMAVGMLGVSIVGIGSFWAYQQMFVPQPVELGSDEPVMVLERPIDEAAVGGSAEALQLAAAEPRAVPELGTSAAPAEAEPARPESALTAAAPTETAQLAAAEEPAAPVGAQPPPTAAEDPPAGAEQTAQPTAAAQPSSESPTDSLPAVDAIPAVKPADGAALPTQSFEELLEHAENLSRHGQSAQAVDAFERALQRQPGAPAALAGKAYAYLNLNDQRAAKSFAQQAVEADPTDSRGWIVLGAAEELLGSRSAAQEAYRRCAQQGVGRYVDECRKLVH